MLTDTLNMEYFTDCISICTFIVIITYECLKFKRADNYKFPTELGYIAINLIVYYV